MEGLARRVVLTGSESTGKTSLTAILARHYGVSWVPEYVRDYADRKGAPLDAGDVEPIAAGQIAVQDTAALTARGLLLLDTDLLSTAVYARHYYGSCPEWIEAAVLTRRGDLYLLCAIDVPWAPDPQRDRPDDRVTMQALFRRALEVRGFRFAEIRGGPTERVTAARAAIDALAEEP